MFVKRIPLVLILICAACGTIASPPTPQATSPALTSAQPPENTVDTETPETKTLSLADQVATCAEPSENPMTAPNVFAWQLFISINACGSQPQWTGWKSVEQVYLPNGAAPKPWGDPPPPAVRPLQNAPEISGHRARAADGKPLLYDVLMNQPTFDYIVDRQFYSRAGQINFFNDPNAPIVEFPWDALEIKTVWLILDPKSPSVSRYYTINASFVDDKGVVQNVLVGLAGMHITSKVIPNWVWATFEQIDNASTTMTPVVNPIPADVQSVNNTAQLALRGTVWQYYALVGTQIDYTNAQGQPTILANTLIETDFQKTSSCMTCHVLATRGSVDQGRLGFFNVTSSSIEGYVGDPATLTFYDAYDNPVTYDPATETFVDESGTVIYKALDFVWSLREAQ